MYSLRHGVFLCLYSDEIRLAQVALFVKGKKILSRKLVWLFYSKLAILFNPFVLYLNYQKLFTFYHQLQLFRRSLSSKILVVFEELVFHNLLIRYYQSNIFQEVISMKTDFKKLVMTALFAALACVATMSIRIPTPGTSGYIHPGDAIVILSGIILGPMYGFLAGGIGSAMADLIGGYFIYVPITFAIKGLIALLAGFIYQKMGKTKKSRYVGVVLGGITDIVLVAGGYFLCELPMYGIGAAVSIPANLIQGVSGLVIALLLYPVLTAIPDVRQLLAASSN